MNGISGEFPEDDDMPLNLSTKPVLDHHHQHNTMLGGRANPIIWSPASLCEKETKIRQKRRNPGSDEFSDCGGLVRRSSSVEVMSDEEDDEEEFEMVGNPRSQLIKRIKLEKNKKRNHHSVKNKISSENNKNTGNQNNGVSNNSENSVLYKFKSEIINRIKRHSRSADEEGESEENESDLKRQFFAAAAAVCAVSNHQQNQSSQPNSLRSSRDFNPFDCANLKKICGSFDMSEKACESGDNNCSSDSSSSPINHSHTNKDYLFFPSHFASPKELALLRNNRTDIFALKKEENEIPRPDSTANHFNYHGFYNYNENSANEQNLGHFHHQMGPGNGASGEDKKRERNFLVSLMLGIWVLLKNTQQF